jgi:ribosomal protein L44E
MNKAAQALGRLSKGKPKTLTKQQREFRRKQMEFARAKRWVKDKT